MNPINILYNKIKQRNLRKQEEKLRKQAQQVLDNWITYRSKDSIDDIVYCPCGHECTLYELYDPTTKLFHNICYIERKGMLQDLEQEIQWSKENEHDFHCECGQQLRKNCTKKIEDKYLEHGL